MHAATTTERLDRPDPRPRRLVESGRDVVLVRYQYPPGTAVDYVSASVEEVLGYTADEIYANPQLDVVHPDDIELVRSAFDRDPEETVIARLLRKDGSVIWAERTQIAVRDETGALVAIEAILRDITRLVEADEALRGSEAQARATRELDRLVVENSKDLICLVDLEGQIVFASPSHTTVLGITPEELTGKSGLDFVHPDDRQPVERGLAAVVTDGFVTWAQTRLLAADGTVVPVEGSATVVPDDAGEPQLILLTSRDISERLRAERLTEQLHHAQKLESVGKLAGGVAHDFNNLLTAINGYSDLALASVGASDDRLRTTIQEIRRAGERAAELTQQLLAFSRQQVLKPELIDLNRTVAEFGPMLARLIGEDLLLALRLGNDVSAVRADRGQIGQVVLNLAVNARDAMPDGGTVTITTQTVQVSATTPLDLAPGSYSVLSITDTGVGIAPELIDAVFEPFYTTKPTGEGTGLGLSMVHGIVQQSGGSVSVYSAPGHGTTFRIYLPAVDEAVPESNECPVEPPAGAEHVLLVEDNDAVRALVLEMLEERGYHVVAAATPGEALQVAAELEDLDLLVTDVVMPEMNGRQLAERLVADRPVLRVLFMSGYTDDAMIARGVVESDVMFLQKPFSAEEFGVKVREALDVAGSLDPDGEPAVDVVA